MLIDLQSLDPRGIRFDQQLQLSELTGSGAEPISVFGAQLSGSAQPGPDGVDLRAHLRARLRLHCSRCLESLESLVDTDFELVLVPDAVEFGVGETQVHPRACLLYYAEGGRVDLEQVAREQIYLNLPLKPICGGDCQGLCPTCGVNRNRLKCGCRSDEIDPRLAPLLDLRKKMDDS